MSNTHSIICPYTRPKNDQMNTFLTQGKNNTTVEYSEKNSVLLLTAGVWMLLNTY